MTYSVKRSGHKYVIVDEQGEVLEGFIGNKAEAVAIAEEMNNPNAGDLDSSENAQDQETPHFDEQPNANHVDELGNTQGDAEPEVKGDLNTNTQPTQRARARFTLTDKGWVAIN